MGLRISIKTSQGSDIMNHEPQFLTEKGVLQWAFLLALWSGLAVVRPMDLIDNKPTGKFKLFDKPQGGLFGVRQHVPVWGSAWWNSLPMKINGRIKMPVLHDIAADTTKSEL